MSAQRIVSLLPSSTEIVHALGLGDRLVGRSHECDYPQGIERLPALTAPKRPLEGSSRAIDERVKEILREGLGVYRIDAERLRDLHPDLIITQTQCDVCAASLPEVEAAVCEWMGSAPRLLSLEPNRLADVWSDVERVATAAGVPERAAGVVRELEARMDAIAERAAAAPGRPKVACVEWLDPLMVAGNWVPELVAMAGGENLLGIAGEHSPWLSWEELHAAAPEVLVVMPCGFGIERSRAEMHLLTGRDGWGDLPAVREGRVAVTDGHHYFNRPGPRLVDSLEILAEILHPDVFEPRHRGNGWVDAAGARSPGL